MADVFVSYASQDRTRVAALVRYLQAKGRSVWWDQHLVGGERYHTKIDDELKSARAVLVCWSKQAAVSDWVRSEAEYGRQTGKLVSLRFDSAPPPRPFDQHQIEDLSSWAGVLETPALLKVSEAIEARVEDRAPRPVALNKRLVARGALVAFAVGALSVIGWLSGVFQPILLREDIKTVQDDVSTVRTEIDALRQELLAKVVLSARSKDLYLTPSTKTYIGNILGQILDDPENRRGGLETLLKNSQFVAAAETIASAAPSATAPAAGVGNAGSDDSALDAYLRMGALYLAGDYEQAEGAFEKALAIDPEHFDARIQLGHVKLRLGETGEAVFHFRKALQSAVSSDDALSIARASDGLGRALNVKGDYDDAIEKFNEAILIFSEAGDVASAAAAHNALGSVYASRGDLDDAENSYSFVLDSGLGPEHLDIKARALRGVSVIAYFRNDLDTAEAVSREALDVTRMIGDAYSESANLGNLGIFAYLRGDYAKAEENYRASLDIDERLGNLEGASAAYNNLGKIEKTRKNYREAQALFEKGLLIDEKIGTKLGIAISLHNLGITAAALEGREAASKYFQEALDLARELGNENMIADNLVWLARLRAGAGDAAAADESFAEAKTLFERKENKRGLSIYHYFAAERAVQDGRADAAREHLLNALAFAEKAGSIEDVANARTALIQRLWSENDRDAACFHHAAAKPQIESIGGARLSAFEALAASATCG